MWLNERTVWLGKQKWLRCFNFYAPSAFRDGYPIDFAPDYSPGFGISSNSSLLHLTLSCADYSYEETKLLLELGANVNATDAEGNNALIIAAMSSDSALLSDKEILLVKEILDKT